MAKGYLYDNGDELITREDVNEVPDSSTAHAGDVLELDSNKKPKWTAPESELPSTGSASVGDVLTLDSDKDPVWSAPSGGGGVLVVTITSGDSSDVMDKTYSQILDAVFSSGVVIRSEFAPGAYNVYNVDGIGGSDNQYLVLVDNTQYVTDSTAGYPAHTK